MIKKIILRNESNVEMRMMLEPWTNMEDIAPSEQVTVIGDFFDEDIVIDFCGDNFISIWSPPGCVILKS